MMPGRAAPGPTGRAAAALIPVAVLSLLLTACSVASHFQPEPAAVQDAVDCSTATGMIANPGAPGEQLKGRVPAGFVPVDVVRCTWEFPAHSSSATTMPNPVITEEHLSGDYAPLLAALAEPSDRGGARSCLDYAEILPELWLVSAAGGAVHVQWPLDSCEKSKPATATALAALTVTTTSTIPAKEPTP